MAERDFFEDDFDPSTMIHATRKLEPGVGGDPKLRVHIVFLSEFGKLVPWYALRNWRARFRLYYEPELTDIQKAQKISNDAWGRLEALKNRRKPLPE